ncbi:hypothetical protein O181_067711 [Austropuccinia psidii MF-1]|uniref:Integrase catalytic domain-containing protein n=1 Tax=Austropuccinia psidii MF-1 TaxID=1389203 RepID=A0A9Q3I3B2_9BASI|nr:hypothetical protein [Austropuccinia psidii MF-1]
MDLVTALPPDGDRRFNACLVLADRYSKSSILFPFNEDKTAMDTAIMIWNIFISNTGLFQNMVSDKDPRCTSAVWKKLHNPFGTKLSFSMGYLPQAGGLAEGMRQIVEAMIQIFCAYGMELLDSDGCNHEWCVLLQALELVYKT